MTNCTLPDCQGQAFAKGLCVKHYTRMRRHGDPATVIPAGRKGSDGDPGNRLALFYRVHDGDRWRDGSSDQSIASLIADLKAHVETRREDIARFIVQYRAGMPIHILDFCARLSGAMRQDDERKAVLAAVKEVKVTDHLAAVGKGGDLGRLSVMAFCHWALSQVAEASEVEAFFAALMDDEIKHDDQPIIHQARAQLIHQARSKKHVNSPYAPDRQAWIILQAWIECRTGSKSESGRLPTLEELGVSLEGGWQPVPARRRSGPRLTAEEQKLITVLEKDRDQPMTKQEISLSLEQARALGVID
jgi:hypothetical protein